MESQLKLNGIAYHGADYSNYHAMGGQFAGRGLFVTKLDVIDCSIVVIKDIYLYIIHFFFKQMFFFFVN